MPVTVRIPGTSGESLKLNRGGVNPERYWSWRLRFVRLKETIVRLSRAGEKMCVSSIVMKRFLVAAADAVLKPFPAGVDLSALSKVTRPKIELESENR